MTWTIAIFVLIVVFAAVIITTTRRAGPDERAIDIDSNAEEEVKLPGSKDIESPEDPSQNEPATETSEERN